MDINFLQQYAWVLGILAVWDLVWKGMALWRAARIGQKGWFIALLIINSAGILPIIYLLIKKGKNEN